MKNKIRKPNKWQVLVIVIACSCQVAISQDLHFSQYYNSPLIVNPALTGVFNGDLRGIVNYRDQWSSVAPFKTYGLSIDAGMMKKKMKNGCVGAGLNMYQDEAGDSDVGADAPRADRECHSFGGRVRPVL